MNRIRILRKTGSMSQKELADVIGVSQSLVSYWEREKRTPSVVNAQKLADFFGVEIKDIFAERTAQ
jgi:transcriptional regulator with XRE-family HTH domain|nr:MAG TPA: helix-turn-helix domain protein [Caudoviricetes sp.]